MPAWRRERIFEFFSNMHNTPVTLIRLFYAVELRYGVLVDIAYKVFSGEPVDLSMGHLNWIWQGDANDMILRSLALAHTPPQAFNLSGPQIHSVRALALQFGELMSKDVLFTGNEAGTALVGSSERLCALLGTPGTPVDCVLRWTANWICRQGRLLERALTMKCATAGIVMVDYPFPPPWVIEALRSGLVIPAHPLALTTNRKLDERRQRALTRYYAEAGAGGVAVGVHTTQFTIREPGIDLYEPVLELTADTLDKCEASSGRSLLRIAGICGDTPQATQEARLASDLHYHAGLLSLAALKEASDKRLIEHCQAVAEVIPLFGFYLQPAVGGRILSVRFWHCFVEIPNVIAIKIAPFNRYQTLDVIRAVAEVGRAGEIALYTGNDEHIILDLLARWEVATPTGVVRAHIAGGLLGHWAFWTQKAVSILEACKATRTQEMVPRTC